MTKKQSYIYLCLFYLLHYMTMGVYSPYVNVYYERLGFNGSQIGTITSIGLMFGMLFAPLWGILSDKTKKYRLIIGALMILSAISIFIWSMQTSYWSIIITSIFLLIFRSDISSLADTLSVKYCNENDLDFSIVRSLGSLGYLLGAFVVANILNALGFAGPYVYVYMLLMILGALILFKFPQVRVDTNTEKFNLGVDLKALVKNVDFIYITIIMVFTSMIIDCAVNYGGNHLVMTLKQDDTMIGFFSCAMVLPEVFIVMKGSAFFKRFGFRKFYIFATITQVIRCIGYAISGNAYIFLLLSTFHGIMIVASCVGNINFMHKAIPSKILATAMSVYSAIYTVGSAFFAQVFGIIYEYMGSNMIFILTGILSMIPLIMIIFSKRLSIMDNQE